MKLIKNSGNDRVVDELKRCLAPRSSLDVASPTFSLFAFAELRELLNGLASCRLVLPADEAVDLSLLGTAADRPFRNRLQMRWLAKQCARWIDRTSDVRRVAAMIPQATLIARTPESADDRVIVGNCTFTTEGLGITPGNQFGLIQSSENAEECALLGSWFAGLWNSLLPSPDAKRRLSSLLNEFVAHKSPSLIYCPCDGSKTLAFRRSLQVLRCAAMMSGHGTLSHGAA